MIFFHLVNCIDEWLIEFLCYHYLMLKMLLNCLVFIYLVRIVCIYWVEVTHYFLYLGIPNNSHILGMIERLELFLLSMIIFCLLKIRFTWINLSLSANTKTSACQIDSAFLTVSQLLRVNFCRKLCQLILMVHAIPGLIEIILQIEHSQVIGWSSIPIRI